MILQKEKKGPARAGPVTEWYRFQSTFCYIQDGLTGSDQSSALQP